MSQAKSYRYAVPTDASTGEGQPSGTVRFIVIPTPTYDAFAVKAAERGMSVAHALSLALDSFFKAPKE
jgi:hypothetical protein